MRPLGAISILTSWAAISGRCYAHFLCLANIEQDHSYPAPACRPAPGQAPGRPVRSEEHTSELQSLMRISYAVFCLKKKKTKKYNIQLRNIVPVHEINTIHN